MRCLIATCLVLATAIAVCEAAACRVTTFWPHVLDPAQSADRVAPGAVDAWAWIAGEGDGGCATTDRQCRVVGRRLVLALHATDDRTPPDQIGYRILPLDGARPFADPGDVRPIDGVVELLLVDGAELGFTLELHAIDLNGNIGPRTTVSVAAADAGGCATHDAHLASLGLVGLALLVARRATSRTARR